MTMMPHALPAVIGRDFSGVVEAVGPERTDVTAGDPVLGFVPSTPPLHAGTYTDRLTTSAAVLAAKPEGLSFEAAAAIPLAGVTALDSVDAVALEPGDVILVVGATGGVGSFAVQLAAQRGATVIATAAAGDEAALVRSLGATQTIDHTAGDLSTAVRDRYPDGVQALIDLVDRGPDFEVAAALVADGGRIATTLGDADVDALAARDVRATNIMGSPTPGKLTSLADQVVAGTLRVEIQQTFPLAEADDAIAMFAAGTRGKLVLTID